MRSLSGFPDIQQMDRILFYFSIVNTNGWNLNASVFHFLSFIVGHDKKSTF